MSPQPATKDLHKQQKTSGPFYRCPKPIGEEQCSFFLWLDEAIPSPSQNRVLPPTPQSAQALGSTLHEPPSTPTPSSRKRTNPDDMLRSASSSLQFQKRAKHGDEEIELEEHPAMSEWISVTHCPTSNNSLNTSVRERDPNEPSMSQDTACSETSEEFSADSVARKLQYFNELPDYIRKLERRKLAAERSRDAKARKILDLEAEVERLRRREKELEELVALLEST